MKTGRRSRGLCAILVMIMMLMVQLLPMTALATDGSSDGEYYLSYKKYRAAVDADGTKTITFNDVTDQIGNLLAEGMRRYEAGVEKDGDDGYYKPFSNSYGFWYETSGFEKSVMGYISQARVTEVELHFSTMKKAVNDGRSVEEVQQEVDDLMALLHEDADTLDEILGYTTSGTGGTGLALATFGAVLTIIVREGLEAILILGAIVAYLIKTENRKGTKYVYAGAILALIASFVMAFILYSFTQSTSNSIPQEYTEGITALIAVVVLFYVSNWMVSKAESQAWSNYIKGQVADSVGSGKMFALAGTAFLAVFREGAEVILFCQQYITNAATYQNGYLAVAGGVVGGLVIVMIVFFAIRIFGVKLPLGPFFMATSILMAVMSVSFIGAGMWELFMDGGLADKIGGVVAAAGATIPALKWMSGNDILTFFGIYPTWLTLGPQLILTVIIIITFALTIRKGKKNQQKEN